MVVSPRYAEYEDARNTGTSVPVLLPPSATSQAPSAAACNAADSSPALCGSQSDVQASSHADTAADLQGQEGSLQQSGTLPKRSHTATGAALQQRQDAAQYYLCRKGKVDHVFVDHPMYCRTSDIYGSSNVNTYQEAGDFPDLDLRYSILCQAALAAPLLLWHSSQDAGTAKKRNEESGAAARQQDTGPRHTLDQGADHTLPGVSHLHLLSAGSGYSAAPAAAEATGAPMHAGTSRSAGVADAGSASTAPVPPLQAAPAGPSIPSAAPAALPSARLGSARRGPADISSEAGVANGAAAAAEHGCHPRGFVQKPGQAAGPQGSSIREAPGQAAGHQGSSMREAPGQAAGHQGSSMREAPGQAAGHQGSSMREAPGQAAGHQGSSMREAPGTCGQAAKSAAPLVFVSNDWPCAPLALRLEHSVRSAQVSSAASQVHSAPQGMLQELEHEGSGASISSGEP